MDFDILQAANGTAPAAPPPGLPGIGLIAGPFFLGFLFSWGLFGILTVQVYVYYLAFPEDPLNVKAVVYSIYLLECLQVALLANHGWSIFGTGWGSVAAIENPGLLWFAIPMLGGLIACIVQCFYARRIYKLSNNIFLAVFIVLIALMQMSGAWAEAIESHIIADVAKVQTETFNVTIIWLGGSAFCDVVITACMVWLLSSKVAGGFKRSQVIVSRIVRFTLESGIATAGFAATDLIVFLKFKHNNLHVIFALVLTKLYSNSTLALLNSRAKFINGRSQGTTQPYTDREISRGALSGRSPISSAGIASKHRSTPGTIVNVDIAHERYDEEDSMGIPMGNMLDMKDNRQHLRAPEIRYSHM